MARITMKEIARRAGVHRSTVDKVLHDRPGVSPPIRERIKKIICECGYVPNAAGVALKAQNRTFRIAVLFLNVDAVSCIRGGIETCLAELAAYDIRIDYHIFPADTEDNVYEMEKLLDAVVRERTVDGVILMPLYSQILISAVNRLHAAGIPTVLVNGILNCCDYLAYVGEDSRRSGAIAAHIMALALGGRGEIAIITPSQIPEETNSSVELRRNTFRKLLSAEFPNICVSHVIENREDRRLTEEKVTELLHKYPEVRGIYNCCAGAANTGEAVYRHYTENTDAKPGCAECAASLIPVITHEAYPDVLHWIRCGAILCTISSELQNQGLMSLKILMDYLLFRREPEVKNVYTRNEIILRENSDNVIA